LELENLKIPKTKLSSLKTDIGDYIKEQVLLKVADAESPVTGRSFKALSKDYKALKDKEGFTPKPNLEKEGDLLNALDVTPTAEGFEIGIYGAEAPKADGHNNFSGDSSLPERRFIPKEGQNFDSSIQRGVEAMIADAIAENTKLDLEGIETQRELFAYLKEVYTGYSVKEIREIVKRNADLWDELEDFHKWLA
jgi:hypothetical protein